MSTPSELTTFKGDEEARKFFFLYKNVVTKSLPDNEMAEKIVAYLSGAAFDFYFDRLSLDNATAEEAKQYGLVMKVMLEKFSTQKKLSPFDTIEAIFRPSYQGLTRSTIRLKLVRMSNSSYFEMP